MGISIGEVKMGLTPRQEKFCQVYMETGDASEAYRQSYSTENMKPQTVNRNAHAQLSNNKISARVDQLKQRHMARHDVTIDSLVSELEQARQLAIDTGKAAAMVQASMGKAKLLGLVVEKQEHDIKSVPNVVVELNQ